jgi:circadian clock protein KaiB
MKKTKAEMSTAAFEKALSGQPSAERYVLRLYVTGLTPRSNRAIANVQVICNENLEGRYDLEVIDINQQPALAASENVVAVPMLIKKLPLPLRRIIGDLSDKERVLVGLGLARKTSMQRNE